MISREDLRDSVAVRRIAVLSALKASQTNWDLVRDEEGDEGVRRLAEEYADEAIADVLRTA